MIEDTFVPNLNATFGGTVLNPNLIIGGANDDLWAIVDFPPPSYGVSPLYYFSSTTREWYYVTLDPILQCEVNAIAWDSVSQQLLVALLDLTAESKSDLAVSKIVAVDTTSFPPNGSVFLGFATVANCGTVVDVEKIEQEDGTTGDY